MTTLKLGQNMPKDLVDALYKTAISTDDEVTIDRNNLDLHQMAGDTDETDLEFAEFLIDDPEQTIEPTDTIDDYQEYVGESDTEIEATDDFTVTIGNTESIDQPFKEKEPESFDEHSANGEQTEEKKDFIMLYKARCLKCSFLIPGLLNERHFDECHFNTGNVNCPAKNLRIIKQGINIEEQARKIALSWAEGDVKRLNVVSTRLLTLDEYLVKKVMQRAKEKYHAFLSGESI